jgi:outer membrane protein OmpA-like peptidoglycan-associated protein
MNTYGVIEVDFYVSKKSKNLNPLIMKSPAYPINTRYFFGTSWPVLIISSIALSFLLIFCHDTIFKSASEWAVSTQKSSGRPENSNTPSLKPEFYAAGMRLVKTDDETNKETTNDLVKVRVSAQNTHFNNSPASKKITLHKLFPGNVLPAFDKNFIRQNAERNDSIVKLLATTIEMYSFHFKKKEIGPITDRLNSSRDSLLMLYANGTRKFSKIIILGFTDNTGGKLINIKLGQTRAEMVKDKLVKMGIPPDKIVTASFGYNFPIDTNTTAEGRANNRRVEVNIQDA